MLRNWIKLIRFGKNEKISPALKKGSVFSESMNVFLWKNKKISPALKKGSLFSESLNVFLWKNEKISPALKKGSVFSESSNVFAVKKWKNLAGVEEKISCFGIIERFVVKKMEKKRNFRTEEKEIDQSINWLLAYDERGCVMLVCENSTGNGLFLQLLDLNQWRHFFSITPQEF